MHKHVQARVEAAGDIRPRVVLLTTGALNPIHLGHIEQFERARAALDERGYATIGGFLSPSHDAYVRPKMSSMLPPGSSLEMQFASGRDRLRLVSVATDASDWLSASSWEVNQPGFRDFPDVLEACDTSIRAAGFLSRPQDCVMYVCGDDHYTKCGLRSGIPTARGTYSVVVIPRGVSIEKKGTAHAIIVSSTDVSPAAHLSSTKLRAALNAGDDIKAMVPPALVAYLEGPCAHLYRRSRK